MKEIQNIPSKVIIGGLGYRVEEHDSMIIFSEECGFWGCCERMIFYRPKYACWQLELKLTSPTIMASHIVNAFKLVQKWRGDDFGREI